MTHVPYVRHAEVARAHLGDSAPVDTCVRLGMRAWPNELGLEDLDTDSVTEAEKRARAGYKGWSYHEGVSGIRVGFYADWKPSVLAHPTDRHVCVVDVHDGDRWRGIGAGTPSGHVAHQPASGGMNVLSVLQGYFIPPSETPAGHGGTSTPPKATPATVKSGTITVAKGDTVDGLARRHRTTRAAILRANPAGSARKAADFRIVNANLIYVGQRLHIPT